MLTVLFFIQMQQKTKVQKNFRRETLWISLLARVICQKLQIKLRLKTSNEEEDTTTLSVL
jgi:hypothetical protein